MDHSPAIASNKPFEIAFKRPRETASDSEDSPITPALTKEQRNTVIHICRELHKYRFGDADKLQNVKTNKKRRIISKAMYIQRIRKQIFRHKNNSTLPKTH